MCDIMLVTGFNASTNPVRTRAVACVFVQVEMMHAPNNVAEQLCDEIVI